MGKIKKIFEQTALIFVKVIYKNLNILLSLLKCLFFPHKKALKTARKILVFRIGNIGDNVCAIPSMVAIRENFLQAEISLLSSPGRHGLFGAKELFKNATFLTSTIIYYQDDIRTLKGKIDLINKLRAEKFELFIELPQDLANFGSEVRNLFLAKLIGVKYAFGFRVNTIRIFRNIQSKYINFDNEVKRLLLILEKEGLKIGDPLFKLDASEEDKKIVNNFLKDINGKKMIAINPGTKRQTNLWPLERFAEVGKRLIKERDAIVIILGSQDDNIRANRLKELMGDGAINAAGKFTAIQAVEFLKYCRLLISGDTGAVHMAVVAGIPIVGIYSARDFRNKWFPYGKDNIIFRKQIKCQVCFLEKCRHLSCLNAINSDEVYNAAEKILLRNK